MKKINKIIFDSTDSTTDLCELGLKYHTDKSPISTYDLRHSYTILYDLILGHMKYKDIKLAEIGIWKNASIKSFRDYFPNAEIHGFEKVKQLIDDALKDNLKNTFYHEIDISNVDSITESFRGSGVKFDVIVDDGSHIFEHQINVILNVFPFLNPGGVLIIEDIFKSIPEKYFEERINPIRKYFSSVSFIETNHKLQYTGSWDNDKLLVLYRNDLSV